MRVEGQGEGMFPVNNIEKQYGKDETRLRWRAHGPAVRRFVRARIALSVACAFAIFGFAGAAQVRAQSKPASAAPPTFEVASIKPSEDIAAVMGAGRMPHVGMKID